MGHLSAKAQASSNKEIKVTHFREISKSLGRLFSWSHSGLFLGLMQRSEIEANCLCGRMSPFLWFTALTQDNVRRDGWIDTIGSHQRHLSFHCPSMSYQVSFHTCQTSCFRLSLSLPSWKWATLSKNAWAWHVVHSQSGKYLILLPVLLAFLSVTRPWALSFTVLQHSLST